MDAYEATKELLRGNREFYRAFEKLDLPAMRALWLEGEQARCVHPGGELVIGYARILESWQMIFAGTESIRFELVDVHAEVQGEAGWVTGYERIYASREGAGPGGERGALMAEAAATNVFRRVDGRWRLVLHHASPVERRFFAAGS